MFLKAESFRFPTFSPLFLLLLRQLSFLGERRGGDGDAERKREEEEEGGGQVKCS